MAAWSEQSGVAGGSVGSGTAGGAGGEINLTSRGKLTLNGDVRANGSAGGDIYAMAGNGGFGALQGGPALAGRSGEPDSGGYAGGEIHIKTKAIAVGRCKNEQRHFGQWRQRR